MSDLSDTAPAKQVGEQVEIATINSVTEITDEDFNNPTRSIILPSLPQRLLNLIGKKLKPVLLKKNVLEKNKNNHPELSAEDNRKILDAALYHSELIGQSQPDKRPNYWVAVKLDSGKNAVVVFDMEETKTHHEIVGWHFANEKGLANLQKQAVREGGQILDMRNNSQSPSDQTGTDATNTIPPSPEKSSAFVMKDGESLKNDSGEWGANNKLVSRDVYEAAKDSIQKVIDNGQTPLLAFVYRNPADAWFNGVQKRNKSSDGHIVPEATFINTHAIAKENFLKLMRDFGDKVQYIIKEVADGKASEITIEELENKPKYTKEQIKEAINAESYARARAILERLQQGDGQTTESRGSKLAPGRTEKRSNEIQRIDTGADRDSGRVSGRQKSGSVTSAKSTISKITSAQAGSRERIMAFAELPDGEHTVNGKTFTKSGNAFTLDDKTLNAKEIEKATESPANPSSDAHGDKGDATVTPENSADNTIPPSAEKSSGDSEKIISKITSAQAGSRERIMVFTDLVSRDVYIMAVKRNLPFLIKARKTDFLL